LQYDDPIAFSILLPEDERIPAAASAAAFGERSNADTSKPPDASASVCAPKPHAASHTVLTPRLFKSSASALRERFQPSSQRKSASASSSFQHCSQ